MYKNITSSIRNASAHSKSTCRYLVLEILKSICVLRRSKHVLGTSSIAQLCVINHNIFFIFSPENHLTIVTAVNDAIGATLLASPP